VVDLEVHQVYNTGTRKTHILRLLVFFISLYFTYPVILWSFAIFDISQV